MLKKEGGITAPKSIHKLFAYPGGKWPIRNEVVSAFPSHTTYVDVFGGSAAILLTKKLSDGEIFNDKNEELVNFFRVVKHRPAELAERAKNWIHSRTMWSEFRFAQSKSVDEIERAFAFWVRLQDSFGAMGKTFGMAKEGVHSVTKSRVFIDEVSERLKNVHIECCSFESCLRNYDSSSTFFYLDPPYPNTKGGSTNYNQLSENEWKMLRKVVGKMKGKFLLSCNADPFVIKLFQGFCFRNITVRVTLARKKDCEKRKEILVSNYYLPRIRKHNPVYREDARAMRRTEKRTPIKFRKERKK